MRLRFLFLPLLLLLCHASADTIVLKSGEKIDGKIVKESETEYIIEFKASASITDSRVVLKSEVEKVEKEAPDEIAFQAIKSLKLGANSLAPTAYDGAVRALQGFLNQFPQSPHVGEITPLLTDFANEKERVDGGELKLDGKWISKEAAEKERYQLSGRAVYGQMQEQARRGDFVGALNTFDFLERTFPGASVFPDAAVFAAQLLAKFKPMVEQVLKTWQYQKKERDTATQLMAESQRGQVIAAQKAEEQRMDAALAAAKGVKWLPLQHHEKTLNANLGKIAGEQKRVEALPVAKMRESLKVVEKARTEQAAGDLEAALKSANDASLLWTANEYAARLKKDLTAEKLALAKATPTPPPATPEPEVVATPKPRATPPPQPAASTPLPTPAPEESVGIWRGPIGLGILAAIVLGLGAGYFVWKKKKAAAQDETIDQP